MILAWTKPHLTAKKTHSPPLHIKWSAPKWTGDSLGNWDTPTPRLKLTMSASSDSIWDAPCCCSFSLVVTWLNHMALHFSINCLVFTTPNIANFLYLFQKDYKIIFVWVGLVLCWILFWLVCLLIVMWPNGWCHSDCQMWDWNLIDENTLCGNLLSMNI